MIHLLKFTLYFITIAITLICTYRNIEKPMMRISNKNQKRYCSSITVDNNIIK